MRTLIDVWVSGLRLAIRVRMSGATVGLVRVLRLLFPAVPRSNLPGPAVGGRRVAGIWVMSPETTSAVFLAGAALALARRQHVIRRVGARLSWRVWGQTVA
jgi:hypothetical protein